MRILVVDDHADSRDLVLEWVRMLGHEAIGAGSVSEAIAEVERGAFEVIVTDLLLPDGHGAEIVHRVHARGGKPRAVAITGLPPAESTPFDVVLTKPVDLDRLEKILSA